MEDSEEILKNKTGLTKQGRDTGITSSGSKIVTKNLKERKFKKVRERERKKERKIERGKLVLTI